jgi:hypothetical protein
LSLAIEIKGSSTARVDVFTVVVVPLIVRSCAIVTEPANVAVVLPTLNFSVPPIWKTWSDVEFKTKAPPTELKVISFELSVSVKVKVGEAFETDILPVASKVPKISTPPFFVSSFLTAL